MNSDFKRLMILFFFFMSTFWFYNISLAQTDSANHQTNNSASVVHHDSIPLNHFLNFVIPIATDNSIKPKDKWKLISPEKILKKNSLSANDKVIVRKRNDEWKSWMFYLLLGLTVLLVFLRVNYAREFSEVFQIFKPIGINQQIFRDNFGIIKLGTFLLSLNSTIVIGVYFFLIAHHYNFFPPFSWLLLVSIIIASVLLIIRFVIMKIAGSLFPFKKEINFYQFNEVQLNRLIGILLLPFLITITFSPNQIGRLAIGLSFVMVIAIVLFRYLRGFSIGNDYFAKHKFHFIVYICTLEIAPLVIFVKVLKDWAKGL